jgi:hypothetical protein
MEKIFKMEKQYMLFIAMISLWVVHKLVNHTHGLFEGNDAMGNDAMGNDAMGSSEIDDVKGEIDQIGTMGSTLFAGMSFMLLFIIVILFILLPFLIFIRWVYLEITCKSCE